MAALTGTTFGIPNSELAGGLSIAGTGLGVAGTIADTVGKRRLLGATAAALELQARLAAQAGQLEIKIFRRAAQFRRGGIVAAAAASGVRVGSGSAFDVLLEQARNDGTQILQMKNARAMQIWDLRARAKIARFQRSALLKQMPLTIAGQLFTGGAQYLQTQG